MKRYLTEGLGLAETPNSSKPIFRLAHENDLLTVPLGSVPIPRYTNRHIP